MTLSLREMSNITLAEISDFIAGDYRTITIPVLDIEDEPINVTSQITATFSLSYYYNNSAAPILSKKCEIDGDNAFTVTLVREDTIDLHGYYLYQITLTSSEPSYNLSRQGVMVIHKNNNPDNVVVAQNGNTVAVDNIGVTRSFVSPTNPTYTLIVDIGTNGNVIDEYQTI